MRVRPPQYDTSVVPLPKDGHFPLHQGEAGAGAKHSAADGINSNSGMYGGLDVAIRVEIDPQNREGATDGYGFSSKYPSVSLY